MPELQERIRGRDKILDRPIADQQNKLQRKVTMEYNRAEREREDNLWQKATTTEGKAHINPHRLLRETLLSSGEAKATHLILNAHNRAMIHAAGDELGLENQSVNAPPITWSEQNLPDRWIVVGTSRDEVIEEIRTVYRQTNREQEELQAAQVAETERKHAEMKRKHASVLSAAMKPGSKAWDITCSWDITGSWDISCDELENYFAEPDDSDLHMEIFEDQEKGAHAFFAEFYFSVIEGVMRINKLSGTDRNAEHSTTYRWRGSETGESEIQMYSDEKALPLTFSEQGITLEGYFEGDLLGPVKIVGYKIAEGKGRKASSSYEWDALDDDAHEEERVSRWH